MYIIGDQIAIGIEEIIAVYSPPGLKLNRDE